VKTRADILAIGAVSALGVDDRAWANGAVGAPARSAIGRDERLAQAGLRKPFAARVADEDLPAGDDDRAVAILRRALAPLEAAVAGQPRVGVAIGTSSGGMASAERLFATLARGEEPDPALARAAQYHAPFRFLCERLGALGATLVRTAHLVTACSSSTIALGLAKRWLELGECDLAIAGGYDALTIFVAAGFEVLGATTASPPPRPSRLDRDGMSLGEGAALFLLARVGERPGALAQLAGFGASGDAVHLTAPDREGAGLARAAERALDDARVSPAEVGLASLHGTSTPFNDPMEAKALARALASGAGAAVPIHAAKATIGHTLGAAGALETALAVDALRRGILPATAGAGELDPAAPSGLRERTEAGRTSAILKLSSAFGGANGALVLTEAGASPSASATQAAPEPPVRCRLVAEASVGAEIDLDRLAAKSGLPRDRLGRMDGTSRLALEAVSTLAERVGRERLRGAGLVLGTCLATIDVNALFAEGMRRKGAAHAEPRRFAYTTPNAAAGECAMAFQLTGPNLAVSRGEDAWAEAEEIGRDLIAAGDAARVVVVGLDAEGPVARQVARIGGLRVTFGARAALLERDGESTSTAG
jgi:3-oxoacyl-[acyl-carrier-protein] synthase-1/3-oxoacyl-[acyl-carrier-protein] synthase II